MVNSVIPRSDIVQVNITITNQITKGRNFGLPIFITAEDTLIGRDIDQKERVREYSSIEEVAIDWATTSEVYKMCQTLFSQNPRPELVLIGQRFFTDQSGFMQMGQVGSTVEEFQAVTNGSFGVTVDGGTEQVISDLDLTSTNGKIACGVASALNEFQLIDNGSFKIIVDGGIQQDITGLDFIPTASKIICGESGIIDIFQLVSNGSFKITVDDNPEQEVTGLNFIPVKSKLTCGVSGALGTFQTVSDGSFKITIDGGTEQDITGLDFTLTTDFDEVADVINGSLTDAVCSYSFGDSKFVFESLTEGINSDVTWLTPGSAGTDISGTTGVYLSGQSGAGGSILVGSGASSLLEVAEIINITLTDATCVFDTDHFDFISDTTGISSNVTPLSNSLTGTSIASPTYLNGLSDVAILVPRTGASSYDEVASIISDSVSGASCIFNTDHFEFISDTKGINSTVSALSAGSSGIDISGTEISGEYYLNGLIGTAVITDGVGINSYDDLAEIITLLLIGANCYYNTSNNRFEILSQTVGDNSSVSALSPGLTGTNLASATHLNGLPGVARVVQGLTVGTIVDEMNNIITVNDSAYFIAFTKEIRDNQYVEDIADWVLSLSTPHQYFTTSNNPYLLDSSVNTDIASILKEDLNNTTWVHYSSKNIGDDTEYPEVSALGRAATVNFDGQDTTLTMKFKKLPGISIESGESVPAFRSAQLSVVNAKNANVYSQIGNNNMIVSDGVMSSGDYQDEMHFAAWLADSIEVAVSSVLFNSLKVPYTEAGVSLLESVMIPIFEQAIRNGSIAPQIDLNGEFKKAYTISRIPVRDIPVGTKTSRIYDGFSFIAYLAGAIHAVRPIVGTLTISV
jgi:hypothetical protein